LDEERKGDLSTVLKRIRNRELELCTDQVVAGLSFRILGWPATWPVQRSNLE
jgi:hypothetical protein